MRVSSPLHYCCLAADVEVVAEEEGNLRGDWLMGRKTSFAEASQLDLGARQLPFAWPHGDGVEGARM